MQNRVAAPQQARSKRSLDRLVDASIEFISEGTFDAAPVTQIVKRANSSIGSFYSRFGDKDALFHVVQDRVLAESRDWVEQEVDRFKHDFGETGNWSVADCVRFVVSLLQALYQRKTGVYRSIFLHTRVHQDPELSERLHEFNHWCLTQSRMLFENCTADGQGSDFTRRMAIGLEVVAAVLREKILFGSLIPTGANESDDNLIEDLIELYLGYVSHS